MRSTVHKNFMVDAHSFRDDGVFPNSYLPVLHYRNALCLPTFFASDRIRKLFEDNHWTHSWKSGIFTFHHYHSLTHEVLGVYKGKTTLLLGGQYGKKIVVERGDVLLIPAGVSHKNLGDENDARCIGAYPDGKDYDMMYGKANERPGADKNIYTVGLPSRDPIQGFRGKMQEYWKL